MSELERVVIALIARWGLEAVREAVLTSPPSSSVCPECGALECDCEYDYAAPFPEERE